MKGNPIVVALGLDKEKEEPSSSTETGDYDSRKLAAAEEVLAAFESKDSGALKDALSAFCMTCCSEYEDTPEPTGMSEEEDD